jgi:hypothetical protein
MVSTVIVLLFGNLLQLTLQLKYSLKETFEVDSIKSETFKMFEFVPIGEPELSFH